MKRRESTKWDDVTDLVEVLDASDTDPDAQLRVDEWEHLEAIWNVAGIYFDVHDHVGKAMRRLCQGIEDDYIPPADDIRDALERFYSLPEAEARRLLNGWQPDPDREGYDATMRIVENRTITRSLRITDWGRDDVVRSYQEYVIGDMRGVTVLVSEGTSKLDALRQLTRILEAVRAGYEGMITTLDGGYPPVVKTAPAVGVTAQSE